MYRSSSFSTHYLCSPVLSFVVTKIVTLRFVFFLYFSSMKKFRKYKKKEKKAWRKFHKKSQKYFEKQDVFDLKGEDKFDATAWKRGKLELKKEIEQKQKELSETVGRRVNFFF